MTTNHNLNHQQLLAAGRFLAKKRMPYFSAALYSLIPRPVPKMMETMGAAMGVTPNCVMIYDPEYIEKNWTIDDVEFGLLHEISHVLRGHSKVVEQNGFDPRMFNLAADAAINDDLMAAGCKPLPSDMLPSKIQDPQTMKPMPEGLTEHAYYNALKQMKNPPQPVPGARPGSGMCGGAAGNPLPGEEAYGGGGQGNRPQQGQGSQSQDGGRSEIEIERIKKQVARDIQNHASKGHGSVPGGWQIWADQEVKPPKVRWQDKLRRVVRGAIGHRAGMLDYTYRRPSRRQSALGYGDGVPILPSMTAPAPRITVAFDTSGSMSSSDLARAGAELRGILGQTNTPVNLISCDAEVHGGPRQVKTWKEAMNSLKGGGGTDFGPIFKEVEKMRPAQDIVIVLTDGGGPAPATPPKAQVVWVLIGKATGNWDGAMVPWVEGKAIEEKVGYGEMIWVEDD